MQIEKLILSLSLLFCVFTSQAQVDKSNYSLLWEVSGNGLSGPSYFFGTMHLRDVRAFEFSDSVLLKLDECKAFAMELQPDSMMNDFLKILFTPEKGDWFRENLSPSAYESLNESMIKKTGKPLDSLDNQNPLLVELMLSDFDEPENTKKKPQVLDLYLANLSRKQGKKIYGLEKLNQYENLTRSYFNLFEKEGNDEVTTKNNDEDLAFDEFVEIYRSGDLNEIWKNFTPMMNDKNYRDEMLDKRNERMVSRFVEIGKVQSVFCAVGTAHLPGKNGILEILKKQGFTVRKVTPAFTGLAEKYSEKQTKYISWEDNKSLKYGFRVSTPTTVTKPSFGDQGTRQMIETMLSIDIYSMNAYLIMALPPNPQKKPKNGMEAAEDFMRSYSKGAKQEILTSKKIKYKGAEGGEFKTKGKDGHIKWRVLTREGVLYSFCVFREDDNFQSADIDKFFESVEFFTPEVRKLKQYEIANGAYAVNFPSKPIYKRNAFQLTTDDGARGKAVIHLQMAFDPTTSSIYFARHNDYPTGIFIESEDAVHEGYIDELTQIWDTPVLEKKRFRWNGHSASDCLFKYSGYYIYIRTILRGKRFYVLMYQNRYRSDAAKEKANIFFDSFEFRPFLHEELHPVVIPESEVQISFPGEYLAVPSPPESIEFPTEWEVSYYALDTLSGFSYSFLEQRWSPYYEVSADSLYQTIEELLNLDSTIYNWKDTTFMGYRAWEVQYFDDTTGIWSSNLSFIAGDSYYEMNVYKPEKGYREKAWEFFNTFTPIRNIDPDFIYKDKTALIFQDLVSEDSLTMLSAKLGLRNHVLTDEDWPLVYSTLKKEIPHDTSEWQTIHELLLDEIIFSEDKKHIPFLKELYEEKEDDFTHAIVLNTIISIGKEDEIDFYFKKATKYKTETQAYSSHIFQPFYSEEKIFYEKLPEFIKLRKNKDLHESIISLITHYANLDSLKTGPIHDYTNKFISDIKEITKKHPLNTPSDTTYLFPERNTLSKLLILLQHLKTSPPIIESLNSMSDFSDIYLLESIASGLIIHEQTIPDAIFEKIYTSPVDWYDFILNLEKAAAAENIPQKLLKPTEIAKAKTMNYLYYEYGELSKIELLENATDFNTQGEDLKIFAFRFSLKDFEGEYVAICSQPKDGTHRIQPYIFDFDSTPLNKSSDIDKIVEDILSYW